MEKKTKIKEQKSHKKNNRKKNKRILVILSSICLSIFKSIAVCIISWCRYVTVVMEIDSSREFYKAQKDVIKENNATGI